eukprot:Skav206012  [mRNA]  locus=scaffold1644:39224:40054:+ [translate_table: standard]
MPPTKRKLESTCDDSSACTDLYKILGVPWGASQREIVQSYHRMALEVHPDKGGDARRFQEVAHAYEVLSDAGLRHQYDVSVLERGNVAVNLEGVGDAGSTRPVTHVLADFPADMVQVLLATSQSGWQNLLTGFTREQCGKLLDCLSSRTQQIKIGRKPGQHTGRSTAAHVIDANLSRTKYLHAHGTTWAAGFTIRGLVFETPRSTVIPVLAFYHSAAVDLRSQLLQRLQGKPDAFEAAVTESLKTLGCSGFRCRFTFRSARRVGGKNYYTMTWKPP